MTRETMPAGFDPKTYRDDVAAFGLSPEQEDELLFTLWNMMRIFAEIGHGAEHINSIFPDIFEKADQAVDCLPDSGESAELRVGTSQRKDKDDD